MVNGQIKKAIQNETDEDAVIATYEILQPIMMESFGSLSEGERLFCLVMQWTLEMEMEGFNSYYLNFYGDEAQFTLNALAAIGSTQYKEIFKESMTVFEDSIVPVELEDRYDAFEADETSFNEVWARLDLRYKKCGEDMDSLLCHYLKYNIVDFR